MPTVFRLPSTSHLIIPSCKALVTAGRYARRFQQMTEDRLAALEKDIQRLIIKLETLVNHLNVQGTFGPPNSRDSYDSKVKQALARANL